MAGIKSIAILLMAAVIFTLCGAVGCGQSSEIEIYIPQTTTQAQIGHHGSKTSTTAEFLAAVDPRLAVISADPDEYGHPHPEVMARLEAELGAENIYLTAEDGTIEFITDGTSLWLELMD